MKLRLNVCGLVALAALSCGSSSSNNAGITTMGTLGEPATALISGNLVFVNASMNAMDEDPGYFGMLIDSGSPVVLIDPSLFNKTPPTTNAQIPTKVNLGLIGASGQPVVVIDNTPVLQVSNAMMDALGFGGILGGDVMQKFPVQLDYAAPMMEGFCLGCTASTTRTDVQLPGGVVPFTLAGGGTTSVNLGTNAQGQPINSPVIAIPPTRIPVNVFFDGTDSSDEHLCILDTGATEVSLRSTVYAGLVSDGRAQLTSGIAIMTIAGASNASVSRAKSITVGGVTISDPPVMTIVSNDPSQPDPLLDNISNDELHEQIDCLLGGSFLRNFLVTIDYPGGQLHLQPYVTPPIPDEFRRVGFTIGLDASGMNFVVSSVYPNTDAATQGVMVNDEIASVDGTSLISVGYVATADALLDGTPGTSKMITFGKKTGNAALANTTISIMVDDLIPNP
ncbi:MAG TPA: aspartyl protease family protein [Polyangia bacterium]|nr:aspartyl protease family protein [Polyangia bacterium]